MPLIDSAKLAGIARRVFAAAGSDEEEAGIVADHLVEANLNRCRQGGRQPAGPRGHRQRLDPRL